MKITKPHVAMFASPGMGHIIPVIELGKRLAGSHGFHVTIFVLETDAASAQSQFLNSPGCDAALVDIVGLPTPDISGLVDPSAFFGIKLLVMMRETIPTIRSKIEEMQHKPTALIVDLFGLDAIPLGGEFNMLTYIFIASNARFLAVALFFPTLDKDMEEEHIIKKQPMVMPGCEPVRFEDTLETFLDPNSQLYREFVPFGSVFPTCDGIIVNTWDDMEPKTLKSLQDPKLLGRIAGVPVYPIGPLSRPVDPSKTNHPVLDWLNKQPDESVLYISFGSGGSLSAKQLTELAWGLEMSQQRFVWVVRPPVDGSACSAYLSANSGKIRDGTPDYLPGGFVSRTHERGFMVSSWAPQAEILAHQAVGGFLTHCGWNSILESVVGGVPMIAWPLFAEQMMNATLLNEELGVAVRSKKLPSEGVITRAEIEALVRKIMVEEEGAEMRKKIKKLKETAAESLSCDGGVAHESLSRIADESEHLLERVRCMARGA
ncbi:UDP-glycosyltransferase 72E1 [Arabidopsis thaliana]|uniref:Glycosyltransferase n=2 Tax=Arabidopsis TaxID=3701 RepID=A0A178VHL9_ARATH|nr:UDP-glucuronosyl/UDP-glucosyltransferase [Arabidopsis thaliana x Arabidopsis arenosa]OAP04815.1 UGT72E1 [Arabidopsis thaliana]